MSDLFRVIVEAMDGKKSIFKTHDNVPKTEALMDLKNLSDDSLHTGNIDTAREECEVLNRMLHRLRETARRRLYSKYKCQSLFEYAVKYLKYSNDQADRRIKAMRLLRDVPEIEEKINDGALNLTNLALAQKLFTVEKKSGNEFTFEQRTEVLSRLENQTTRAAEKIVYEIQPEMKPNKKELGFQDIEDDALREKLLQVKGLFAHTDPNLTLTALLHKLCDSELAKKTEISRAPKMNSKAEIRRQVWRRDGGKCRNCGSMYALQIEHIKPQAVGGEWTVDNLCLLCRHCNQRSAIEYFGMEKMERYLKSPNVHYAVS